ncbi:hypothetical protein M2342_002326 [Sphingobium sp. B8D3A]|nr:hypothetical protein [Sphingobium sp. B8D3A]
MTSEGFLIPDCYHGDITHANRRYGRWVLKQISTIVNDGVCFK